MILFYYFTCRFEICCCNEVTLFPCSFSCTSNSEHAVLWDLCNDESVIIMVLIIIRTYNHTCTNLILRKLALKTLLGFVHRDQFLY